MLPLVIRWLGSATTARPKKSWNTTPSSSPGTRPWRPRCARSRSDAAARGLSDDVLALARARHEARSQQFPKSVDEGWDAAALGARVRMDLIAAEREYIYQLLRDGKITDESRRKIERELDLEEAMIACKEDDK